MLLSSQQKRCIMSKWTETRDAIVDALNVQDVTAAVLKEVLPIVENAVDSFTETTKAQAAQETGWCKIRDAVVLPLVLQGAVYVVKTVLEKTVTQTA